MASILSLNEFVTTADRHYSMPVPHYLVAEGMTVIAQPLNPQAPIGNIERNSSTWNIFKRTMFETIGETKFNWICQRYRFNFTKLESGQQPLLPDHIKLFSVGSGQILANDIEGRVSGRSLEAMTRAEIKSHIPFVQLPPVGPRRNPIALSGSPGNFAANFLHNKRLMDEEKQILFSDAEQISFSAWLERFCKVTVNREFIQGQVIPVPGQDGQIDYYKVCRKIAGDGLVAYALTPAASDSTRAPMIIFRPSQWAISNEDALLTYVNDAQPNIGEMGWNATEACFSDLMSDLNFRRAHQLISIAGFSLGGVHMQRFLARFHQSVSYAASFNAPYVDKETAEAAASSMNSTPRAEPLSVEIFQTDGDVCHDMGDKHVGWGATNSLVNVKLTKISPENPNSPTVSAIYLHSRRIFDFDPTQNDFPYRVEYHEDTTRLNELLDNSQRGPTVIWREKMRVLAGSIALVFFRALAKFLDFLSALLGVRILRSSRESS